MGKYWHCLRGGLTLIMNSIEVTVEVAINYWQKPQPLNRWNAESINLTTEIII